MGNTTAINLAKLKKDIIKLNQKHKQVEELIQSDYPSNYEEIAQEYINPRTGKPITRGYIMLVRKQLEEEGKLHGKN